MVSAVLEFTDVLSAISKGESALAMVSAVLEFTDVFLAISKGVSAPTIGAITTYARTPGRSSD